MYDHHSCGKSKVFARRTEAAHPYEIWVMLSYCAHTEHAVVVHLVSVSSSINMADGSVHTHEVHSLTPLYLLVKYGS